MFWRRRNDEAPNTGEDRVLEQLSAYLDGEVNEAEAAAVEALIARDPVADDLFEDLRLMRTAFGALGEVRAPRSFAIPADAVADPRPASSPLALFRRTELFMRASAAVAALFFVVALVNNPNGETPVANFAFDGAQTSMSAAETTELAPTQESLRSSEEGAAGTLAAPAPATTEGGQPEGGGDDSDTGDTGGGAADTMGALAEASPETANTGEGAGSGTGGGLPADATATDTQGDVPPTTPGDPGIAQDSSRSAEELRPLPAGTELAQDSSQGVGGMVLGLGVVAGLLTALSVLTAWDRRSGDSTR